MSRDASVESTDNLVQYSFLHAHILVFVIEAILLVDHFPNERPIVVGKRLDVTTQVKILSLIIILVLHVPNPLSSA